MRTKGSVFTIITFVLMAVMVFANFAFADVTVTANPSASATGGTGTATATGGNAANTTTVETAVGVNTNLEQGQVVGVGGQKTNIEIKSPAPAGASSGFVTASGMAAISNEADLCEIPYGAFFANQYSSEDVKLLADSSGGSRRGSFLQKLFTSREASSGQIPERFKMKQGSSIGVLCYRELCPGTRVLRTINYEGKYGQSFDEALGQALQQAKEEGAGFVTATVTTRLDPKASATTVGLGGANSIMTIGFSTGFSSTSMYKAFDVTMRVVAPQFCGSMSPSVEAPPPPVVRQEPKPEPKVCNPENIWARIKELEQKIRECTRFCFNNLKLRLLKGKAYIDLYACTGDKRYLQEAIKDFEAAERNYCNGHDIRVNQAEANKVIAQVYYYWAGCIHELYGRDAAMKFAGEKKLERIPSGFAQ